MSPTQNAKLAPIDPELFFMLESELLARMAAHPIDGSVDAKRHAFAALADLAPIDFDGTQIVDEIAGVETLVVRPSDCTGAIVVHAHGGGYVFGSPDTHRNLACTLASASGCTLWLPRYPLAPEHPWPAQRKAFSAVLDACPAENVLLAGDSAGGHLALAALLAEPRRSERVRGVALFSPNTLRDYSLSATRRSRSALDAMNDHDGDDALARVAFGDLDPLDPQQTLTLADLSGLPPLFFDVGGDEVLLDDSLVFARSAALAGVAVDLHVQPGAFHLRQLFAGHFECADRSLQRAGAWLRARAVC